MVEILPFRGVRYNPDKVSNLALVVSPPYDVISDEEQENYRSLHPNNVVRLILGEDVPEDTEQGNKYIRAARYFQEWMDQNILKQDEQATIYVYQQDYQLSPEGRAKSLTGFIALVQIEDPETSMILPHEQTMPSIVADRFNLIKACKANLCPVFALYSDAKNQIRELLQSEMHLQPLLDITDLEGVRHQIWRMQDLEKTEAVRLKMKDKVLFIADGHHRYEAARQFRDYVRTLDLSPSESKPYNYVMMRLVALEDEGLTIFPIHRLLRCIDNLNLDQFLRALENFFHVDTFKLDEKERTVKLSTILTQLKTHSGATHQFVMYAGQNIAYRLTLKDVKGYELIVDRALPQAFKSLDVTVLHTLIFDHILGGREKKLEVYYTREEKKALELVNTGRYQLAFFLNPTRVSQVAEVAVLGRRMPPKSTYFYPKPLTGLVLNKL